jgi:hypothetical protein
LNQVEADQLLSDLPRLTAFCRLFEEHPEAFDADRPATEIPVLREPLPNRLLTPQDLEWRPLLIPPPSGFEPFQASADELSKLRSLPRARGVAFEFDCTLVPAGSMIEQGRPCFGRYSLLVEQKRGLIVGMDVQSGGVSPGEAAGRGLAKALLMAKTLPEKLMIGGLRLQPVLQELCDKLEILLSPESSLPALDEALQSFGQTMLAAGGPHRL